MEIPALSESLVQSTQALFEKVSQLETGKPDKPTLVYFDIIGIAQPIRCLLHLKDVDHNLTPGAAVAGRLNIQNMSSVFRHLSRSIDAFTRDAARGATNSSPPQKVAQSVGFGLGCLLLPR